MSDASVIATLLPGPWVLLAFASGFSASSTGYAPAYRIWRDKVELRGSVTGTFPAATSTTPFGTWPTAVTPAQQVGMAVATNVNANSVTARLAVSPVSVATVIAAQAATTVFLDNVAYSLV